jgi:hypothetical protein
MGLAAVLAAGATTTITAPVWAMGNSPTNETREERSAREARETHVSRSQADAEARAAQARADADARRAQEMADADRRRQEAQDKMRTELDEVARKRTEIENDFDLKAQKLESDYREKEAQLERDKQNELAAASVDADRDMIESKFDARAQEIRTELSSKRQELQNEKREELSKLDEKADRIRNDAQNNLDKSASIRQELEFPDRDRIVGTVTAVNLADNTITVQLAPGSPAAPYLAIVGTNTVQLRVDDNTQIMHGADALALDNIKAGDKVTVSTTSTEDGGAVAQSIALEQLESTSPETVRVY